MPNNFHDDELEEEMDDEYEDEEFEDEDEYDDEDSYDYEDEDEEEQLRSYDFSEKVLIEKSILYQDSQVLFQILIFAMLQGCCYENFIVYQNKLGRRWGAK